jgi:hypothetical protein
MLNSVTCEKCIELETNYYSLFKIKMEENGAQKYIKMNDNTPSKVDIYVTNK